jgi:hypothetical protein
VWALGLHFFHCSEIPLVLASRCRPVERYMYQVLGPRHMPDRVGSSRLSIQRTHVYNVSDPPKWTEGKSSDAWALEGGLDGDYRSKSVGGL